MMETITPTKPSRLAGLFKRTPKAAKPLSKEQKAKLKEERRKDREEAKKRLMRYAATLNRAGRRKFASPKRFKSSTTNQLCERKGCGNDVGIVTDGQVKRYCSPECRSKRHNSK